MSPRPYLLQDDDRAVRDRCSSVCRGGCTRGGAGGYQEGGYTGYYPAAEFEAYLWNIEANSVDTAV